MTESTRRRLIAAMSVMTAVLGEGTARAAPDDREQCATSAEQAQQLRDEGKYRRAREQMLVCARDVCPGPIKSDCGKWLMELDRDAPTVVFGAHDAAGADLFDVKVSMDGVLVQSRLDGKPVLVDSGEHTFTFESTDGIVREERVLVRAAEKARPLLVTFANAGGPTAPGAPVSPHPPEQDAPKQQSSIVPAAIVGGIGVVALGSFAVFGLGGKSDVDDLQKCKPYCSESDVSSARTKLIVADVSLGVGVVALGVATYMLLTRPTIDTKVTTTGSALRLDAGPVAGGAVAAVGGRF